MVDRRLAAEGQAGSKDSPRATRSGAGPKPGPGSGPGNAGEAAGASTDGRGGPADGVSTGAAGGAVGAAGSARAAGSAGAGSEAHSAPLDGARHVAGRPGFGVPAVRPGFAAGGGVDAGGATRRALAGDADYCRDYVRYAPAGAGQGGTRRVQRTSDRDGGEEGGGQVMPSAGGRGRGRGRDR